VRLSVVNHVHCRLSTVVALVSAGPLLSRHVIFAPALAVPNLCRFRPSAARSSVVPRPSVRLFAHGYHCLVTTYLSRPWPSQNLCCSAPAASTPRPSRTAHCSLATSYLSRPWPSQIYVDAVLPQSALLIVPVPPFPLLCVCTLASLAPLCPAHQHGSTLRPLQIHTSYQV